MSKTQRGGVAVIFQLLLCCIFLICLLAVLLMGTDVYKGVASLSEDGYGGRTCLAYIEAKLRSADSEDCIRVGQFADVSALFLSEYYDDDEYVTVIYCYEGQLYELFTAADVELGPEAGEAIMEAESLEFSEENGLVTVTCDGRDISYSPRTHITGGKGAAA